MVTAIAEGRQAARQIDLDLMGTTSLAGPGGFVQATHPTADKWERVTPISDKDAVEQAPVTTRSYLIGLKTA